MGPSPVGDGEQQSAIRVKCGYGNSLQWGRRLLATESRSRSARAAALSRASMGPSPVGDGETKATKRTVKKATALQWGRRLLATESARGGVRWRRTPNGFNGAVACWRRRVYCIQRIVERVKFASMGPSPVGDGEVQSKNRRRRGGAVASMGPSPVGDGEDAATTLTSQAQIASMGPSPVGDGEMSMPETPWAVICRFNGAVACWRRRDGRSPTCARPTASFNGAVACWRRREGTRYRWKPKARKRFNGAVACWRRRVRAAWRGPPAGGASMGPSPVGDGELHHGDLAGYNSGQLQWGRRLLATERPQVPTVGALVQKLQWGRRLLATESWQLQRQEPGDLLASMGPSPVGDGEVVAGSSPTTTRRSCFNGAVACWRRRGYTIPGQYLAFERFNGAVACWRRRAPIHRRRCPSLQCFNGAVACWRRRGSGCGHGALDDPGFNGAVACWRRREQQVFPPRAPDGVASMGPSPVGDGEAAEEIERRARNIASMGPSPVGDGELPRVQEQRPDDAGFNGAVACWRRRARHSDGFGQPRSLASMGPSPVGDGEASGGGGGMSRPRASMGPSPVGDGEPLAVPDHLREYWLASMGPSPVGDGETSTTDSPPARRHSFNGAVACWRRRVAFPTTTPPSSTVLQWGRRLLATERSQRKCSPPPA